MKINERGYWENETSEGHGVDENLAKGIAQFLKKEQEKSNIDFAVMDVGCGTGFYTKTIIDRGIICYGFDGNPNTVEISNGLCNVFDFSIPIPDSTMIKSPILPFVDWVLCLEVGEHIPKEYEQIFLSNITWLSIKGIILSWSIPEYGGDGHVNSQSNEYIISELEKRDFEFDKKSTEYLRTFPAEYPTPCYWFRSTLMCFRRRNL